jgi:hypothetical protein
MLVRRMASSQIPSSKEFVVSMGSEPIDNSFGTDTDGSGATPSDRTMVVPQPENTDPRDSWRRLIDQFPSAAWVSPVVVDASSEPHYPTGDVTVRFHARPSDADLETFAEHNGLELRARNEFVPEQASFRPRDARGTYLPDLVDGLERDDIVKTAWLNTKSAYKRA